MSAPLCFACSKENPWVLVSDQYKEICGQCAELDPRVDVDPETNAYALFGYCQGGCDERGPVNYGRHETEFMYYYGRSFRCTP